MTDERDAIAALDVEAEIVEDHQIAVRLSSVLQFQDRASALRACRERKMDLLALRRHLDRHDFVEHLDPALDLRRLRRLVAEAIDEQFDARDFLILLAFGFAERVDACLVLNEILAVVADVIGQRPQRQIGDAGDDGVEEEAIVRDQNDRVRVLDEIGFEPVSGFEIEMVRRLVEE